MPFKVGDTVRLNRDYYKNEFDNEFDNVRGVITSEVSEWGAHVIAWEDGGKGHVYLNTADKFLTLV